MLLLEPHNRTIGKTGAHEEVESNSSKRSSHKKVDAAHIGLPVLEGQRSTQGESQSLVVHVRLIQQLNDVTLLLKGYESLDTFSVTCYRCKHQ